MTLEDIQAAIAAITNEDFLELSMWMDAERQRRTNKAIADEAVTGAMMQVWEQTPELKPEFCTDPADTAAPEWLQPSGAHDSYPMGAVVSHNGRTWQSMHPGLNSWEPGAFGVDDRIWVEVQPAEPKPADSSVTGDSAPEPQPLPWSPGNHVTPGRLWAYNGVTYEVVQEHDTQVGWEPPNVPALFKTV